MTDEPLTVYDVLGIHEGDLIELARGEALIRGRFRSYNLFGYRAGPMLEMNADIGHGYNVDKMIELGWTLHIVERAS